jgi:beta-lactamase class A
MTRRRALLPAFILVTTTVAITLALGALDTPLLAASLLKGPLQEAMTRVTRGFKGRVGVCVRDGSGVVCINGDQKFSLQSVVKLVTAIAVLDAVDKRGWKLADPVVVKRENLSVGVQPIEKMIKDEAGYQTTIADLVRRAIVDSDSAANDILMDRLGGAHNTQFIPERHGIFGMRIERDERHLQTETMGLTWKPEYVDSAVLQKAREALTESQREAAFKLYQRDERDTSTPRAMVALLQAVADGNVLTPASLTWLFDTMTQTVTFPGRLKAGVSNGWTLGHKTGTSGTYKGVTVATNDVGILKAPDGKYLSIAVFIADSTASDAERDALTAALAKETIAAYR